MGVEDGGLFFVFNYYDVGEVVGWWVGDFVLVFLEVGCVVLYEVDFGEDDVGW